MKKASSIAKEVMKLQAKVAKAEQKVRGNESYLNYRREEYAKLPAELAEARADHQAAQDKVTETLAELTKPLMNYHYEARYYGRNHEGPRRYSSSAAQAAWDAERHAEYAEGRLHALECWTTQTLDEFSAEQTAELEASYNEWINLDALLSANMEALRAICGPDADPATIAAVSSPQETPDEVTIPAAKTERGYRVQAVNLAKLPGKAVSFAGLEFYAAQIKEWAKLEAGNIVEFVYDEAERAIRLISPTSRACFKSGGDKNAPALVFAS